MKAQKDTQSPRRDSGRAGLEPGSEAGDRALGVQAAGCWGSRSTEVSQESFKKERTGSE